MALTDEQNGVAASVNAFGRRRTEPWFGGVGIVFYLLLWIFVPLSKG